MNWQEGGEVIFLFVGVCGNYLFVTVAPPRSLVERALLPARCRICSPPGVLPASGLGARKQEKPN